MVAGSTREDTRTIMYAIPSQRSAPRSSPADDPFSAWFNAQQRSSSALRAWSEARPAGRAGAYRTYLVELLGRGDGGRGSRTPSSSASRRLATPITNQHPSDTARPAPAVGQGAATERRTNFARDQRDRVIACCCVAPIPRRRADASQSSRQRAARTKGRFTRSV